MRDWDARYRRAGLVIIGVHTPEFLQFFIGDGSDNEVEATLRALLAESAPS